MNYVLNMFDIRSTMDTFSLSCTPLNSTQVPRHSLGFYAPNQITTLCLPLGTQAWPLNSGGCFIIGNSGWQVVATMASWLCGFL